MKGCDNIIYVISDTHFGHETIINSCNRPFSNVDDMNNYMIAQWNKVVSQEDEVIHLGDFAFGNKEYIQNIVKQLNGRKTLVLGNHDRRGKGWFLSIGFENVYKNKFTRSQIIFSHRPLFNLSYDMYNIHGHIHNNDINLISGYDKKINFNVSADVINFTPKNLNEILEVM